MYRTIKFSQYKLIAIFQKKNDIEAHNKIRYYISLLYLNGKFYDFKNKSVNLYNFAAKHFYFDFNLNIYAFIEPHTSAFSS